MPFRAYDSGFGATCEGLIHNTCLAVVDLRAGPVYSVAVTGDDALLVAVAEGLRREDGGLLAYVDARGYNVVRRPPAAPPARVPAALLRAASGAGRFDANQGAGACGGHLRAGRPVPRGRRRRGGAAVRAPPAATSAARRGAARAGADGAAR